MCYMQSLSHSSWIYYSNNILSTIRMKFPVMWFSQIICHFHSLKRIIPAVSPNTCSPCRISCSHRSDYKGSNFWIIEQCSSLKVNRRFGRTGPLHLHCRRRSLVLFATFYHADFSLGSFFDREDGGDMFHRNVGWLSANYYTALYPKT
jgi:hypothetical protein